MCVIDECIDGQNSCDALHKKHHLLKFNLTNYVWMCLGFTNPFGALFMHIAKCCITDCQLMLMTCDAMLCMQLLIAGCFYVVCRYNCK